jgi:hypothetical protein
MRRIITERWKAWLVILLLLTLLLAMSASPTFAGLVWSG